MLTVRQWCVDVIITFWPIMPRRLRLWAFLNDTFPDENENLSPPCDEWTE